MCRIAFTSVQIETHSSEHSLAIARTYDGVIDWALAPTTQIMMTIMTNLINHNHLPVLL